MLISAKKYLYLIAYLTVLISILLLNGSCAATPTISSKVLREIGTYYSPENSFKAKITVSSLGGFKVCEIVEGENQIHRVEDITALIWIGETEILYSVSPIYGKPGIFVFDCKTKLKRVIVKPKNLISAYPNGADYFELKDYLSSKKEFSYYYASDIDSVDFKKFRNKNNILKRKLKEI